MTYTGLPAMTGGVRILFQTRGVLASDYITAHISKDDGASWCTPVGLRVSNYVGYSLPASNTWGGPYKRSTALPGIWSLVVPYTYGCESGYAISSPRNTSCNWIPYVGTDNVSTRLMTVRIQKTGSNPNFSIRNFLAQPERIGMISSTLGYSDTAKLGSTGYGIYPFDELAGDTTSIQNLRDAVDSQYSKGVSAGIWWSDFQSTTPTAGNPLSSNVVSNLRNLCTYTYDHNPAKRIHLYLRGINVHDTSTASAHKGAPKWAHDDWISSGLTAYHLSSLSSTQRWLEVKDAAGLSHLRDLVANKSISTSLYSATVNQIESRYKDKQVIDAISAPSLSCGFDPGQYSWMNMDCSYFHGTYLPYRFGGSLADFTSWATDTWRRDYVSDFVRINDTARKRYKIINCAYLNRSWYITSVCGAGTDWNAYKAAYNGLHKSLFFNGRDETDEDTQRMPSGEKMILTFMAIDKDSWEDINKSHTLAGDWACGSASQIWLWNLRAASQEGAITWGQASNDFFSVSGFDATAQEEARSGIYNAFLAGVRGFELYYSKHFKRMVGNPYGKDILNHYNTLFEFRDGCGSFGTTPVEPSIS